ncbi:hypothetical protein B0H10DRAFT_1007366 [Mycena sp. CBHHK59/15]|nr:hypothetical protein B0H10DRAFT_1007366 [Mycena sp. CBHHK59/15]
MPPQTGMFPLPYPAATKDALNITYQHHNAVAGPSSRPHTMVVDDPKKDFKKRKEISGKLGKEIHDRRDECVVFTALGPHIDPAQRPPLQRDGQRAAAHGSPALHAPRDAPAVRAAPLPLSLERSALLVQLELEEKHALDCAHQAYEEERQRVEDEWRRGRDRVRERLLEGIEERRRRAREEKEGEGTVGDASMEQSRPHITRKLRNKMGTSPPPTPLGAPGTVLAHGAGVISNQPITSGPFLNPHSLAVDEIPSPFPLPLTSTTAPGSGAAASAGPGTAGTNGRRRPKGSGTHLSQAIGGLGKSLAALTGCKESEIENDLVEIRRANKRRRAAQGK